MCNNIISNENTRIRREKHTGEGGRGRGKHYIMTNIITNTYYETLIVRVSGNRFVRYLREKSYETSKFIVSCARVTMDGSFGRGVPGGGGLAKQ